MTLKLSDEQATALQAKAAAEGLSLDEWIQKLAEPEPPVSRPIQHIANIIVESMKDEVLAEYLTFFCDGSRANAPQGTSQRPAYSQ